MTQFEKEQLAWLQVQVLLAGRSNLPRAYVQGVFNQCFTEQQANREAGYPVPTPAQGKAFLAAPEREERFLDDDD